MKKPMLALATISLFSLTACDPGTKPQPVTPRTVQNPGSADKPSAGGGMKVKEGDDAPATKKSGG